MIRPNALRFILLPALLLTAAACATTSSKQQTANVDSDQACMASSAEHEGATDRAVAGQRRCAKPAVPSSRDPESARSEGRMIHDRR